MVADPRRTVRPEDLGEDPLLFGSARRRRRRWSLPDGDRLRLGVELVGLGCLVAAGALVAPALGLAVAGLGLIIAATFAGRT